MIPLLVGLGIVACIWGWFRSHDRGAAAGILIFAAGCVIMYGTTSDWFRPFTDAAEINAGLPAVPGVLLILGGFGYIASSR